MNNWLIAAWTLEMFHIFVVFPWFTLGGFFYNRNLHSILVGIAIIGQGICRGCPLSLVTDYLFRRGGSLPTQPALSEVMKAAAGLYGMITIQIIWMALGCLSIWIGYTGFKSSKIRQGMSRA